MDQISWNRLPLKFKLFFKLRCTDGIWSVDQPTYDEFVNSKDTRLTGSAEQLTRIDFRIGSKSWMEHSPDEFYQTMADSLNQWYVDMTQGNDGMDLKSRLEPILGVLTVKTDSKGSFFTNPEWQVVPNSERAEELIPKKKKA